MQWDKLAVGLSVLACGIAYRAYQEATEEVILTPEMEHPTLEFIKIYYETAQNNCIGMVYREGNQEHRIWLHYRAHVWFHQDGSLCKDQRQLWSLYLDHYTP